jgi:hypothetical protein
MKPSEMRNSLTEFLAFLKDTKNKLEIDTFKSTEEFQTFLKSTLVDLGFFTNQDGNYHKELYFNGNVDKVAIYFETSRKTKTKSFTAKNYAINHLIFKEINGKTVFLNADLEEIFETDIVSLNRSYGNYFYSEAGEKPLYYYLDRSEKKMTPIEAEEIKQYENGLITILKISDKRFIYGFYNNDNKKLINKNFKHVKELNTKSVIAADVEGNYFLIDNMGTQTLLKDIESVQDAFENMIPASTKNNKSGYLDMDGKIAIPFKYKYVNKFSEGLAAVANENTLFGYIDKKGKQIIPFKYQDVDEFNNGFTMVKENGLWQIIDTSGKVIVKADSKNGSFSMSGDGQKTIYKLGNKKYDAFGKLITE